MKILPPFFLSLLILALPCQAATARPEAPQKTSIAVQPFTGFDADLTKLVARSLEKEFGFSVRILPAIPLPESAYYKPRARYRADRLLQHLENRSPDFTKVIGLTHKDISTTKGEVKDWGIFGLGSLGGRPCVVSTHRLRARGADEKQFRQRLVRIALHEIGHTLDLGHCPHKGCNMADAKGSILTVDQSSGKLCAACLKHVQAHAKSE